MSNQILHPSKPCVDHVAVWRSEARLLSNEELLSRIDIESWNLQRLPHEADAYPAHVLDNSRLNSLAVIAGYQEELAWRKRHGLHKSTSTVGWPKAFIEQVKATIPIENEVARHVLLSRQGRNLVGTCPFHLERTSSFIVFPSSGRVHCFGCGFSGDVIAFTQAIARISFREAIECLADLAGIALPVTPTPTRRRVKKIGGADGR